MPSVNEIVDMYRKKENNESMLRIRWDDDYDLWTLKDYHEKNGKGVGYEQYTSNDPRTTAKKGISLVSGAKMKLNVHDPKAKRKERDEDNAKEQLVRGLFKQNDERLVRLGQTGTLRQAMAWQLGVRGTTLGRVQLRRHPKSGRTFGEAVPWDPRDTTWAYGSDGLDWICHKFAILREKAEADWNLMAATKDPEIKILIGYDWYDGERNIVAIPSLSTIKAVKDEVHGLLDGDGEPRVPAWVNANTLQPLVIRMNSGSMTEGGLGDGMHDFGESIFADNRHQYEAQNKLTSIDMELASRSREPGYAIKTREGVRTLDSPPYQHGPAVPMQHDDSIEVFDMLKSSPNSQVAQAKITTDEAKGGFPPVSFGSLQGSDISGFAITQLKGGVSDKVLGMAQAGSSALMAIANIWCDHFNTNAFDGIELSGEGRNRRWFASYITPEMIEDLPQVEIELVPQLPEDQAGKVQQAIQLSRPQADGMPTLARQQISEDILQRPDSDLDLDSIMHMMATSDAVIRQMRMTNALANRGDIPGAMASHNKFKMLIAQEQAQVFQMQALGIEIPDVPFNPETDETRRNDQTGGFSPEVLPNSGQGIRPPTPGIDTLAQSGSLVAAETPRPGGRTATLNGGGFDSSAFGF